MGRITLNIQLRPTPTRLPRLDYSTDLSEAARTLSLAGRLLDWLRHAAGQVELGGHLLTDILTKEEEKCLEDIKCDTQRGSMAGIGRAFKRLATLIGGTDSETEEAGEESDLTLEEMRMKARARRIVGVPPCMDIHQDLNCRCCVFETLKL